MRAKKRWLFGWVLLLIVAMALAGCSSGGGEGEGTGGGEVAPPAPAAGTTDVVWQWVSVDSTPGGGEMTTVPNPEAYTVTFRADGTVSGQADCNSYTGTYTAEAGGAMTITLLASTAAACGPQSLEREFLDLLSGTAAGGPDGAGGFALTSDGGADYALFRNGGEAPAP